MNIIDKYLSLAVVQTTFLILVVLLSLGAFVGFAGEVDKVGTGSYALPDALAYIALTLPQLAYDMMPVAALLGALLGLGGLASNSELVIMRAAGISVWRLAKSIIVAGLFLASLAYVLGELIAPPVEQYANKERASKLHKQLSFAGGSSGWIKDSNLIVSIDEVLDSGRTGTIGIYEFDSEGNLSSIAAASSASVSEDANWQLEDYRETRFTPTGIKSRKQLIEVRQSGLSEELLKLSVVDPDQFSASRLWRYVGHLEANNLDSDRYRIAFWARLANLVSIILMCVLALPFVFGSLSRVGSGTRVMFGVLFGVGYYLASKTLMNSGTVYGLDPAATAWLPTAVLFFISLILLSRVR